MKRIKIISKSHPWINNTSPGQPRVDPLFVAKALGAEIISTGGRPGHSIDWVKRQRDNRQQFQEQPKSEDPLIYWKFKILGCEFRSDLIGGDYMRRWTLRTSIGMLRLHHILRSDNDRHFHDHPMDFVSLILWGGYIERTPNHPPRTFTPGSLNIRRAEDLHALKMLQGTAWTFVVAGPVRRQWGFQTEDGWISAEMYNEWKAGRTK